MKKSKILVVVLIIGLLLAVGMVLAACGGPDHCNSNLKPGGDCKSRSECSTGCAETIGGLRCPC